ncbi:hypothetical protein ACVIU4_009728 [Bradyrhizobium barranii subsp. barranii]
MGSARIRARFRCMLSETADFFYKCDDFYNPESEVSIRWDDPVIGINWGIKKPSLSAKDAAAPLLADIQNLPLYGRILVTGTRGQVGGALMPAGKGDRG